MPEAPNEPRAEWIGMRCSHPPKVPLVEKMVLLIADVMRYYQIVHMRRFRTMFLNPGGLNPKHFETLPSFHVLSSLDVLGGEGKPVITRI